MMRALLFLAFVSCHRAPSEPSKAAAKAETAKAEAAKAGAAKASSAKAEVTARSEPKAADPCAMIDAMLAIDDRHFQRFYDGCGEGTPSGTRIVDVRAPTSLLPPETTCPGRAFTLFRRQFEVSALIVRIDVSPAGSRWRFVASKYQPDPTMTTSEDGEVISFESTMSYCGVIGGVIEWTGERWRAFVEAD